MIVDRVEAESMSHAHAEGLHSELPREGCPDCEGRDLREYPLPTCYAGLCEQRATTRVESGFATYGQRRAYAWYCDQHAGRA